MPELPEFSFASLLQLTLAIEPVSNQFFHLKTTFEAHQKLATLSSKIPRCNGKIRPSRTPNAEGNGRRKGAKARRNVVAVVNPILAKRTSLGEQTRTINHCMCAVGVSRPLKAHPCSPPTHIHLPNKYPNTAGLQYNPICLNNRLAENATAPSKSRLL